MRTITFFGSAGSVTGSKHLLEVDSSRVLLDCGIFQGLPDVAERNRNFPFPPDSVNHVILSHAHLDHCGMLPLLVKRGFAGSIFATPGTRDIAQYMLTDMAKIEEQDTEYRQRHHIGAPDEREPLITTEDIAPVMKHFVEVPYQREQLGWQPVTENIQLKFYDAGHILGSAITVLKVDSKQYIAYTGDIGPGKMPLLRDPEVPEDPITTLLMESTYGSREHQPLEQAMERLAQTMRDVCQRGGKMIVPAFSLGRTQMLVYVIHKFIDEGRIPRFPIYVDSPLALDITEIYRRHTHDYDEETQRDFVGQDHLPLLFRNLTYVKTVEESKRLNEVRGPLMIIAASGMMTAGRVVHHLRHCLSDKRNAVFITGYQAEGTLGRRLLEGAKQVELYGDWFTVKATIELFNEFSAHADRHELQAFAEKLPELKRIMLVHGEPHQADDLRQQLLHAHPSWKVLRPSEGDTVEF